MLVSHRKRFIYTKTFKTAGTSVEVYFEPYCMSEGEWKFQHAREQYESEAGIIGYRGEDSRGKKWFNHMSAKAIRAKLDSSVWDDYFKFCVVRNPFSKLVSAFHYQQEKQKIQNGSVSIQRRVKHPVKMLLYNIKYPNVPSQFRHWLAVTELPDDRKVYTLDGKMCVDFVIKQEELEHGIEFVCQKLDVPFESDKILKLKAGTRRALSLQEYYDDQTIALVRERYAFEFEHFGYALTP